MAKSNLYVGNSYIGDIYAGSQLISQVYRGSTKIYDVYYDGQILFESGTPGNYTFTPKVQGMYQVIVIGGGGGGVCATESDKYADRGRAAGGGSGAYVNALIYLTGGNTYGLSIGSGGGGLVAHWEDGGWHWASSGTQSSFGSYITCTAGGGGGVIWSGPVSGGSGGTFSTSGVSSILDSANGNYGTGVGGRDVGWGGAARYGNFGYGGQAQNTGFYAGYGNPGGNGYIRISYYRHSSGA